MNKKKEEIRGWETEDKKITNKNPKLRRWNSYE